MRLKKARVQKYRSVRDTGWFDVEFDKTIMVGPNEAGKTAVLQALQQINPPNGVRRFEALRDYPRGAYSDIEKGIVKASDVDVVTAHFLLEPEDVALLPHDFRDCEYVFCRKLDNSYDHHIDNAPEAPDFGSIEKELLRIAAHADKQVPKPADEAVAALPKPSEELAAMTSMWSKTTRIDAARGVALKNWLKKVFPLIEEGNEKEEQRYDELVEAATLQERRNSVAALLMQRIPLFVLFSNYFRVKPLIQLDHLARRTESNLLDDEAFDYGNLCLLKLLGFTAHALSVLGQTAPPPEGDKEGLKNYHDQLDKRQYQLNASSVSLTDEIRAVWVPDAKRGDADKLRVTADGQYLKVVVEDDLGVDIELDQRSEGFQWLVSFFVVFFAEAQGKHANAVLLLDEPGMSLHGLKQREFRTTISRLAAKNQTLYTTHSPFLVGPDELDRVRVVEMAYRKIGTKIHTQVIADDPAALLPLQEALGYDLAQSLFTQNKNLVLEGLTDYWYLDASSQLFQDEGLGSLNEKIALVPANSAGKVVYYATILHSQKLGVAALLDSDAAGDQAAQQDVLVGTLGNKCIIRTKDAYLGAVTQPEIEDLLRETLVAISKAELGWDVSAVAASQPARPIIDIFTSEIVGFSKYKLAKAYLRWTRTHSASELSGDERAQWIKLFEAINRGLK